MPHRDIYAGVTKSSDDKAFFAGRGNCSYAQRSYRFREYQAK